MLDSPAYYEFSAEKVFKMADEKNIPSEKRSVSAGSPYFADLIDPSQSTTQNEIDRLLKTLQTRKDEWVRLEISERLSILDEICTDLFRVKNRWIKAEVKAKGIPEQTFGEAEECTILATVFRAVRKIQRSLVEIRNQGKPTIPGTIRSLQSGQVVVPVFPHSTADRLLFRGIKGEVWMEPGGDAPSIMMLDNPW